MIIFTIISFFLENIIGLLFNNHYIIPLFFLISLLIFYQVKNIKWEKYLLYITLLGFIYDIVYTNIYINSLLFFLIGGLNILYNKYLNNSFIMNLLFIIFALISYEVIYYFIYIMLGLNIFDILVLLKSIILVLPINIVYYILSILFISRFER